MMSARWRQAEVSSRQDMEQPRVPRASAGGGECKELLSDFAKECVKAERSKDRAKRAALCKAFLLLEGVNGTGVIYVAAMAGGSM